MRNGIKNKKKKNDTKYALKNLWLNVLLTVNIVNKSKQKGMSFVPMLRRAWYIIIWMDGLLKLCAVQKARWHFTR